MSIVNYPIKQPHEEYRHYGSKIRVATLADRFFSLNYSKGPGQVVTFYEYPFPPIQTDRGPRSFIADICICLQTSNWLPHHVFDIEIDDHKHNNKEKDDFRDYCLENIGVRVEGHQKNSMKYEMTLPCLVLRFPGDLKNIEDEDINKEFRYFLKKHRLDGLLSSSSSSNRC